MWNSSFIFQLNGKVLIIVLDVSMYWFLLHKWLIFSRWPLSIYYKSMKCIRVAVAYCSGYLWWNFPSFFHSSFGLMFSLIVVQFLVSLVSFWLLLMPFYILLVSILSVLWSAFIVLCSLSSLMILVYSPFLITLHRNVITS